MITSIVGRLIKKPEVAERIHIPGKRVVNFTVVENRTRGEKRLSVFFNLSMIVGTDAQYELVMRFEKGTILLFSFPRITYVRQTEKSEQEQSINLYAEVDNFKIVAGADAAFAPSAGSPEMFDSATEEETLPAPRRPLQQAAAPASRPAPHPSEDAPDFGDLSDLDDPFAESEPPRAEHPARPASIPAASSGQKRPLQKEETLSRPANAPSPAKARRPALRPEKDLSDLSDPFAEEEV